MAAVVGGVGGLTAGAVSHALKESRPPSAGLDALSWALAAAGALAAAAHPTALDGPIPAVLQGGLVGLLLLVTASDLRERAVHPAIVYPGVAYAVAAAPLLGSSVLNSLFGAVAATAVFAVLYIYARLRSGPGAFGAGDVSTAALLGAVAGISRLALGLVLVSLVGAAIAAFIALRTRSVHASMPYAPAICFGALGATFFPAL